jgi:SAM-dependent methyltransferase
MDIPQLFQGYQEYRHDPDALEIAQGTFNEEALYVAGQGFASDWWQRAQRKPRVLDLCCATGLFSCRVAERIPVEGITLVDTDGESLRRAVTRLSASTPNLSAYCVDAATFSSPSAFDIILMNSAYHHIPDSRKLLFLQSARQTLTPEGRIILGEHFLPSYDGPQSFRESVIRFYSALIEALIIREASDQAVNTIRCAAVYTLERNYEFKVSWEHFHNDLTASSLVCEHFVPIWKPDILSSTFTGSAALVLRPA